MTLTFWQILMLAITGGLFLLIVMCLPLIGVILGAYAVFRTKKEAYEPFLRTPKGEVFSIPMEGEIAEEEEAGTVKVPNSILARGKEFLDQAGLGGGTET